ncbi:hypothetical protein F4774DRAFT_84489 [Daldinia eschscholtzii]|nr:hypothetical protein F4774DRAFT_84489 [Daldinia eschscholtzii]
MDMQTAYAALAAAFTDQSRVYRLLSSEGAIIKDDTSPARFIFFSSFPVEIRDMIWGLSLPPDERELWFLQESDTFANRFPVFWTKFPAIMHACREARIFCQKRLQFEYLPDLTCAVPSRPFRPDLDMCVLAPGATLPLGLTAQLQYVALDGQASTSNQRLFVNALPYLKSLQTLYLIFITRVPMGIRRRMRKLRQLTDTAPYERHGESTATYWRENLADLVKERLDKWDDDVKAVFWDDEKQMLKLNIETDYYIRYFQPMPPNTWF